MVIVFDSLSDDHIHTDLRRFHFSQTYSWFRFCNRINSIGETKIWQVSCKMVIGLMAKNDHVMRNTNLLPHLFVDICTHRAIMFLLQKLGGKTASSEVMTQLNNKQYANQPSVEQTSSELVFGKFQRVLLIIDTIYIIIYYKIKQ